MLSLALASTISIARGFHNLQERSGQPGKAQVSANHHLQNVKLYNFKATLVVHDTTMALKVLQSMPRIRAEAPLTEANHRLDDFFASSSMIPEVPGARRLQPAKQALYTAFMQVLRYQWLCYASLMLLPLMN